MHTEYDFLLQLEEEHCSISIQKVYRGHLARRKAWHRLICAINIQCAARKHLAKKELEYQKKFVTKNKQLNYLVKQKEDTLKWLMNEKAKIAALRATEFAQLMDIKPTESAIRIQTAWRLFRKRRRRRRDQRYKQQRKLSAIVKIQRFVRKIVLDPTKMMKRKKIKKEKSAKPGSGWIGETPFELPPPEKVRELQEKVNEIRMIKVADRTEAKRKDLNDHAQQLLAQRQRTASTRKKLIAERNATRAHLSDLFCRVRVSNSLDVVGAQLKSMEHRALAGLDPALLEEAAFMNESVVTSLRRKQWWNDLPQDD